MIIKEFPNINVELRDMRDSRNPFYLGSLGISSVESSVLLAHALAAGIENTQKFLGATIDAYANGARQVSQGQIQFSDEGYLDTLVEEFAEGGWVYGFVLDKNQSNKSERLLKTRREMQDFLREDGFKYDSQRVARTIFIPTEKYTNHTWDFDYKPEDLEKMVDFQ